MIFCLYAPLLGAPPRQPTTRTRRETTEDVTDTERSSLRHRLPSPHGLQKVFGRLGDEAKKARDIGAQACKELAGVPWIFVLCKELAGVPCIFVLGQLDRAEPPRVDAEERRDDVVAGR